MLIHFLAPIPLFQLEIYQIHDIALGMQYIHYKNIIHGDLKGASYISFVRSRSETDVNTSQANVLIDDVGKGCIADFGLSKIKDDALSQSVTTRDQTLIGTMRFMAPEMMKGKISKEGDVYSFGMLIYQVGLSITVGL